VDLGWPFRFGRRESGLTRDDERVVNKVDDDLSALSDLD